MLEGMAMASTREPVKLRMGQVGHSVVMDLGRADGRIVVISPGSWEVEDCSPLLFRSTEVVGELSLPTRDGHLGTPWDTLGTFRTFSTFPPMIGRCWLPFWSPSSQTCPSGPFLFRGEHQERYLPCRPVP